ncbi:hypothetical protein AD953_03800 [Acetobacter malorum]|uniref:Uncharacterized protein n=1 Tax=Acetobacter malorum TaxID=178901 RepID=A0A149VFB5_9PROT|nr:hypothetical protein AD953_03800 [Acetobacter malorum]
MSVMDHEAAGFFFDVEERWPRLGWLGDQLKSFSLTVDFEVFRPDLNQALANSDGSNATFYRWRAKYGGMDASMISQMKALEEEMIPCKTWRNCNQSHVRVNL